jgi:hypothetical protein
MHETQETQLRLSVLGIDGFWTEITVHSIRHNFLVYCYPPHTCLRLSPLRPANRDSVTSLGLGFVTRKRTLLLWQTPFVDKIQNFLLPVPSDLLLHDSVGRIARERSDGRMDSFPNSSSSTVVLHAQISPGGMDNRPFGGCSSETWSHPIDITIIILLESFPFIDFSGMGAPLTAFYMTLPGGCCEEQGSTEMRPALRGRSSIESWSLAITFPCLIPYTNNDSDFKYLRTLNYVTEKKIMHLEEK